MDELRDKTFTAEHIDLTGLLVTRCVFDGCIVEVWNAKPTELIGCRFKNCEIRGDGWPQELIVRARDASGGRFKFFF